MRLLEHEIKDQQRPMFFFQLPHIPSHVIMNQLNRNGRDVESGVTTNWYYILSRALLIYSISGCQEWDTSLKQLMMI